jgi:hypothetical protein
MKTAGGACFRIVGPEGAAAVEIVRRRLAERLEHGVLTEVEIERVQSAPLPRIAGEGMTLEAFRRCCITWEIDRQPAITSHRPIVGPVLVAAKKLVRRALRFHIEPFVQKQAHFNWNVLLVVRELLERSEHERNR